MCVRRRIRGSDSVHVLRNTPAIALVAGTVVSEYERLMLFEWV